MPDPAEATTTEEVATEEVAAEVVDGATEGEKEEGVDKPAEAEATEEKPADS